MYRYGQPLATLARTLRCAELCPGEGGAVLKFYLRRDLAVRHNGSMSVKRAELLGEVKFVGDGFRPGKPRRLYELEVERTRFRGE